MTSINISQNEFDLFRGYIEKQSGIVVDDKKRYLIETRLSKLLIESGRESFADFYRYMTAAADITLRDKIVDAMTTNETLWFRDNSPWLAFRDYILPEIAQEASTKPTKRFRVWSAACSTGQEPYSFAMLIDEFDAVPSGNSLPPDRFDILGTDISTSAIFIAMAGRYDRIAMERGLTDNWTRYRHKYFEEHGRVSEISSEIKKRVTFKRFNLQDSFESLGHFDIVLLRNVAIYFSDDFKRDLYDRIANAMLPGAYLILGSAETLMGLSDRFEPETHGQVRFYRLRR
jgi:chemotaxis protein methyltransferase CheR